MKRSLYASRPNPYYILAPDFRKNSAGIRVLHMLCDALIRSGHEAYVTADAFNPALMTPPLSPAVMKHHRTHRIEPIMVYPEVVDGNPYEADVVVRYLLNTPGAVGGKGIYDERDIRFAFSRGLVEPGMPEENVLFLQPVDLGMFKPPQDPAKRIPGKVCFYQGRNGPGIDESTLPAGSIRITSGYPATWEELVDIFQTCEFFYSASTTALSAEAALCGCVGVVIPGVEAPINFCSEETGCHGVAWGDSAEEIERARRTMPLVKANLEAQAEQFWPALDHFIQVTQEAAVRMTRLKRAANVKTRLAHRLPSPAQAALIQARLRSSAAPSVSVFILDTEADPTGQRMARTMGSLKGQSRVGVHVISSRGFSDPSVCVAHFDGSHPVAVLNRSILDCAADWFLILRAGDELHPSGIDAAMIDLMGADSHRAVYSDLIVRQGDNSLGLLLRPNLNIDRLLSMPATMVSHWLCHREAWFQTGGFDERLTQSFELDFILRLIEAQGFAGIGHVSEPMLISELSSLPSSEEEPHVIERHLKARGFESARVGRSQYGSNELDYGHWQRPKVSILIPVVSELMQMKLCLALLLENAAYEHYEILFLDQGHSSPEIVQWLADVHQVSDELMRVVGLAADVSLEQACNIGAQEARGEYLVFFDAHVVILDRDWLHQLLNHALRPEVGVVGPKLVKPNGAIYSAGLQLGLNGVACTPFIELPGDDAGFLLRLHIDQNYSAFSRKCLMVRRDVFMAVNGFDEAPALKVWAHVDLCLKIQQAGYLGVWAARVKMLMSDEKHLQTHPDEDAAMYARWLSVIAHDPVQSPNVSLRGKGFEADVDFALSWQPLNLRPLPVVMAVSPPAGTPDLARISQRFEALKAGGLLDGVVTLSLPTLPELLRYAPDVLVLQYPLPPQTLAWLDSAKTLTTTFIVLEVDRLGEMACNAQGALTQQTLEDLQRCFDRVDRVLVSTPLLAESLMERHRDIRLQPLHLAPIPWGCLQNERQQKHKMRVGYLSERGRDEDLALIADAIRALADRVDWVILGECPEALRRCVSEVHSAVSSEDYPGKLASLDLDLAVLPSVRNASRRYASPARLLELGACAVPLICSDVEPYTGDWPVTVVREPAGWVSAIEAHIADPAGTAKRGEALREHVHQSGMLKDEALRALSRNWLPS